ncbi:MAG: hypothetical protein EXR50_02890 [Dehalococcoidia bacterium]|nr:hypothetical protein [Dehalococcoidia bacterium]
MRVLIFSTALLGARTLLVPVTVGMLALQALVSYTYKSFSGISEELFANLPREFSAFIKVQGGAPFGNANTYLTLGYYHPLFLVLGSAAAITLGAQALAGEVDRGTILYLLARPIPRWQVVLSKGAIILPATALPTAGAVAGTLLGTALIRVDTEIWRFVLAAINAWALFSAIGAVALLCSAFSSSSGQAAGLASFFTIISFFIDFLADLWEPAQKIQPFSIFAHYDPSHVVATGTLPGNDLVILVGVTVWATLLAVFIFSRRDLRV